MGRLSEPKFTVPVMLRALDTLYSQNGEGLIYRPVPLFEVCGLQRNLEASHVPWPQFHVCRPRCAAVQPATPGVGGWDGSRPLGHGTLASSCGRGRLRHRRLDRSPGRLDPGLDQRNSSLLNAAGHLGNWRVARRALGRGWCRAPFLVNADRKQGPGASQTMGWVGPAKGPA
jgi:hypothetical protein